MEFVVEELAYRMIQELNPLLPKVRQRDRALADQLTRAASSVALNIAESVYSDPGNRRARLFTAAGSANETRAALRVACERGYFGPEDATDVRALLDRILAMLWKLTRR